MESPALQGADSVSVKSEPCEDVCLKNEPPSESVFLKTVTSYPDVCVKDEPPGEEVCVKAEPSYSTACVKESSVVSAAEELYAGHTVKDELVLGPVLVERRRDLYTAKDKEAMALSQRESVSAVSSLCEKHIRQTPVKFEEFSDDEALHETPQEIFSNRASLATQVDQTLNSLKNLPNNSFGVRKQKKRRNTRQVQSEKENDMIYPLRSKITFKGKRPLNDFRDTNSTGPYTCEICQKVMATKRSVTCHMQNHQEPTSEIREDNTWDCDICEKIFSTKKTMKAHMIIKHSKRILKCDICSKRFASTWYLNAHKRGHNERQMNYCCEICGKRFENKFHLYYHIQDHSEKKQYTCDICKKPFCNKSMLVGHINVHMGVKPYLCKCGKKYAYWASYRKHELYQHRKPRHERERAFLCDICDKRFLESHHLKTHKLVHTGERPHACETCGKRFGAKSNLNTHRLTHVKDKTYSCELCPKKYLTKEGLRQHKRIHTGKKSMKTKRKNKKE